MNRRTLLSMPALAGVSWSERFLSLPGIVSQVRVSARVFRWLVVGCQGATLLVTWPLWQVHASPPMLPALPLPTFDMGVLLLLSLALVLVAPVPGLIAHGGLLFYAMLVDQTRMQPEIISLAVLMWGTLPGQSGQTIARSHLIALWFWAGFNKLLSPAFLSGTGPAQLAVLLPQAPAWLYANAGILIALTEMATGLLAAVPRARWLAGLMALGLHTGILLSLGPLGSNRNESVWPWNVALALAGLAFIVPWREPPGQTLARSRRLVQALAILLLLSPAGWFVGLTDAYLAHHLYSSDVPRASTTALQFSATWTAFEVPLPPEHRLFEQYFRLTCGPGDQMTIHDSRWWFRQQGLERRHMTCPVTPEEPLQEAERQDSS